MKGRLLLLKTERLGGDVLFIFGMGVFAVTVFVTAFLLLWAGKVAIGL